MKYLLYWTYTQYQPLMKTMLSTAVQVFILFELLNLSESAVWGEQYLTVNLTGTLNILLSSSHGGKLRTFSPPIPNRAHGCFINGECVYQHGCDSPDKDNCGVSTLSDYKTDELTNLLREEIYNLKHAYPKMVVNNIHRSKLDANRPIDEATFGQTIPLAVYNWFHGNMSAAIAAFGGSPGLCIDVHGYYTSGTSRTLLGYLISKTSLNTLSNTQLDSKWNDSSIRHLAAAKAGDITFNKLLRGNTSLGAAIGNEGYQSTPSPQIPSPGSAKYYSGGYITKTYGINTDTIQVEIHKNYRSPNPNVIFVQKLAQAIVNFYNQHY